MKLEERLRTVVRNRLEYSIEFAKKRGFTITNGLTSDQFLTATTCCPFGAVYVAHHNLSANAQGNLPTVSVFTIVKLLDLPLAVIDAFLDGFDFETVRTVDPGFPRYRRDDYADACRIALNMGCQFKRTWIKKQPERKRLASGSKAR
jgi:hypothetical protein